MYKLFSIFSIRSLLQDHAVNRSIRAFMSGIARTFKLVNRRALSTIGTTLMLSALLSACGGGSSSSSDTPAPAPTNPTTPTFTVSSSNFSIDENFTGTRTVASVSNATAITVSQSNTGVVTVTNSLTQVNVSSIANAAGRTVLTITATNGSLSATTQVTVTVNAVSVSSTPTFTVSSSNFSIDEDFATAQLVASISNATAITVSQSSTGVVTVTTSNTQVNISSIPDANGRTTLTITATNGLLSATTQVTVTVNAISDTPTFSVSSSNLSIDEDFATAQLVASISNATAITVSQSNTGVVTVTNSTAQVNISSIPNANGRTILTIRATDGALSATTEVTVTVNAVNDPPTLAVSSNSISTVGGFSPITINVTASDVEDTNLTFTAAESTTGVVRVGTSADAIVLSNIPNVSGQTTLTITVVDSSGSSVVQTIAVDVIITTSTATPVLSLSSTLISEQEDFDSVVIRTTATDADGDTLTISVSPLSGIVNAVISTSILSTNTITNRITLTAVGNANGTATLTVIAADVGGQSTEVNIVVVIAAVNDTPTITVPTSTLTVLEDFDGERSVATFADVDSNSLIITVVESTTGVVTVTTSASSVSVSSILNVNGQTTLSITISDGDLSSTAQVVVDITPVNDAPSLNIPSANVVVDEDFATAVVIATATDVENNTLTISVAESTTGVVTVTTAASNVQVASILNVNGQTTLTITVNDGTSDTTAQVVVTVTAVNDAPELIVSTTTLSLIEDFTTAVLIATTRSDVEGDTLTLTVSESIFGVVTVTTTASGVQVSNLANAYGQTTLTLSLSDGTTITSVQVAVSVAAVNDTPTLSVSTNNLSTLGGFTPITINTIASDVEDANIAFTVTESTPGVVRITTSANAIVLNTIAGASGITTLTVSVVDSSGTIVTQTIVVNVTVTDGAAPVLMVSNNRINVQEDFGSVAIRTTASDSDSATLTLTVTPSMRLVNVAISTRTNDLSTITLTAIANLNGTATLTFRATDDGGQTNSTEIVVVVAAVNDTPTITVFSPILTVLEDFDPARLVATFSDVDRGNVLTVAVTESNAGVVTITTSASGVSVAAIAEMNGRTTLNISVSDGTLSSTTEVVVDVTPVNDPPELSVSTSALTLTEDFSTAVVISATRRDIDNDTLTLTVSESTTGVVSVTTTVSGVQVAAINNANGATILTISLSDGTTSTSTQVSVTVTPVNDPPTLSVSPNALTLNEDFATTEVITVTRSDVDGDTLTLTVAESATGVVTVTTTAAGVQVASILNVNGQTTITFTVNDGRVDTTTQVAVIVNAVNDAPSLNIPTTNVVVDEDFATTVTIATATDLENNPLTITVAESTTGVITVMTSTSGVQVASILNASGQTTLTIRVNDGAADTTAQVVVTVTSVNDTPTITVSNNNITAVVDFTTITINTTASDVEDSTLSFSVVNSNTGVVTVSTSTNAIILSAVAGSTGQTSIVVRTTDSAGLSAMQTIAVNVLDATTPTLTVSTSRIDVQEDFGSSVVIQTTATDSNGGSIALSVSTSSLVAVVVSPPLNGISTITNTITLTAINNVSGISTLTVQATSAGGRTTSTEIVVVITSVNDTPTLNIPNANLVVAEDFSVNSTIATAADIDGDTPIFSVVESTTGLVTVSTSAAGVAVSSVLNANGQTTLTITVSDGLLSSTAQVVVTVTEVNDPPTLTIPNATVTRAEEFVGGVSVATASDVDGNPLTFRVIESTPGVIRVTITASDVSISSLGDVNGVTTLSISVSDGNIVSSTAQVVVNVTPVNDPPSLTVSTTALTLDEDFATVLIATTRTDIDSTSLTLTVSESATGVVTVTVTDAGVSVTRIENINGRTTLTITLSDNDLTSMAQVVVDVTPINDPPVLTVSTNALTLNEDFGTLLIATTRSDVEGDALTLTVAESTTGVVTVQTSSSGVSLSSIAHMSGRTTLTITLSDSQLSSTAQVVVEVTPINDAPTFSVPSAILTVAEDFASTLTIARANDVDGDTLTITVAESSTGLVTVTTSASGVQIVSLRDVNGQTTLTLTVSDSSLSITTQVVVTVTAVNDPPVLSVTTPVFLINEDFAAFTIVVNRSDVDSNTLTLTVVESATGVVTVTPTTLGYVVDSISGANGRTTLTITLSDGDQSTTTQVVVDVGPVNDPPVLTVSTTALTLAEDFATVLIGTTRMDIDSTTLTLTVVESTTGVITATVTDAGVQVVNIPNANGQTTLTITLSDGRLNATTQVVVEVTAVNDPPSLTVSTTALTLAEDFATVLIGTTRMDIDSNSLTLTVDESATGVVTVQTTTSGVSVSSIENMNGRTTLTITLSDSLLTSIAQVVIDVTAVNDPPSLTVSTTALTLAEDFATVLIGTTRMDIDSTTLTLTVAESAMGVVTVQTSTSGVSVSSIENINGRTTLTISLSDGDQSTTTEVVIDVTAVNDPPSLTVSTTALTLAEDFAAVLIGTTRMDIDSNSLTLTVAESVAGVVTVTVTTTDVSVSSIENMSGRTTLTITLSDGVLTTNTQVVIDVTAVNDPPVLSVTNSAFNLSENFATFVIQVNRSDVDSNTLTLTVAESATGVVTVTPTTLGYEVSSISGANGRTTLTITLSDGNQSTTTQVVIDVGPVNDPPVLTVSTTALTLAEDFATVLIGTTRMDIDSTTLTLTVAESATGVVTVMVTDTGVQVVNIPNANGQTTLTITLSDGRLSTTTQVVVEVISVNDPPSLSVSTTALTLAEDFDTTQLITVNRSDLENDTLTFSVAQSISGIVSVSTSSAGVQLVSNANVSGQTTLTITLSDGQASVSTQVLVTVNAVNDPPTLIVSSNSITTSSGFVMTTTINTTASDIEDGTLSFSVTASTPGVVTVTTSANAIFLNSIPAASGQTILTVRAVDTSGTVVTQTIFVNVLNRAPVFFAVTNRFSLQEDFTNSPFVAFAIDNEDTITVSVSSTTHLVDVTTTTPGSAVSINLAAIENANGTTTLTIQATAGGQSVSTEVVVVVAPVNDPPSLSVTTPAFNLSENFATFVIAVNSSDVDSNTLTLTVAESTTGVVTVTTTTLGYEVSSISGANGRTTLTITLSDGAQSTTTQVVIDVGPINDPPVLTVSTTALTLAEDFATVLIGTTRMDIDSTTLTLTVAESATGVVTVMVTDTGVQVVNIPNANGQTTLTITLSDGRLSTTTQVVVEVIPVNDPPSLSVSPAALTLDEDFDTTQLITVNRSDIENDTLTFSVAQSMSGIVSVSTSSAGVQVVSIANVSGQTTLTITVSDGQASVSTQVLVTVNAVNDPPTLIVSSNSITTSSGFVMTTTINTTASDIEDGTLSFSVTASTPGVVTVTTSSNAIFLNSIPAASGQTILTVRAIDSSGTIVTQTISVNVLNRAPVFFMVNNRFSLQEDFTASPFVAFAIDNEDTITVSVSSTTHLVDVTTTTPSRIVTINLAAIENANGTTTLTVRATAGEQSISTEVVVVVAPVNDPPALTVSSSVVTVGSGSVVLNVSASDVEDSTLSFSVSTGQGVVNTAITTTSLTITRLDFSVNAPQVMLTLRTTDTNNVSTFTIVTVLPEPRLTVTTGIKTLDFAWSAITSATHYQLLSVPVSGSGNLDLSTTSVVVSPNSTNIRTTTAQALVGLHRYIPNVTNPQYLVGTCHTTSSCGASFRHNPVSLTNAQLNSMIGRLQASNADANDSFGGFVSLSGDGNTLAVGATNEDSSLTGVNRVQNDNTVSNTGAVYLFRRIGGSWSQQAYIKASNTGENDEFGISVSLSDDGNTLAVGAINEDSTSTGVNGIQNNNATNAGAVYVFRFSSNSWTQQAYIKASNSGDSDLFGGSIDISDDGNTLAVGATGEDGSSTSVNGLQNNRSTDTGAVYVFRFSSNSWTQQAYIKVSNTGQDDQLGQSVSLSADGNTLAVGARLEDGSSTRVDGVQNNNSTDTGAVYVFRFSSNSWTQQAYIKASNSDESDEFGSSVNLSADGNTLAVGVINESSLITGVNGVPNNNSTSSGAVYLFRFSSNSWTQQAFIKASNTGESDDFGQSVSLSADGNILAVGARSEDGSATGVGGVDDNGRNGAGATYVFEFANGAWAQQAYIKATDPSGSAGFGVSVSISSNGNTLAVGAWGVSSNAGAVYLY